MKTDEQARSGDQAGGIVRGVAVGVVTHNVDDTGGGRVKVRFPWLAQPDESYWARLVIPAAGGHGGLVAVPEVGDEVLVAFERDDLRFPYVLGGIRKPTDVPSSHAVVLQDAHGNRIRIDTAGDTITIEAKGRLVIKAPTVVVDASGTLELAAGGTLTVRAHP
jgi:uncharacterized protein involved in type VI secretion and phage assembly